MRQNAEEVVFSVSGSTAVSASVITLTEAGLREREHLQEWVLAHPEIIGPDVMVVTFEFDKWTAAAGPPKDRLDILGLGRDGRLVVAELKRRVGPGRRLCVHQNRWCCRTYWALARVPPFGQICT